MEIVSLGDILAAKLGKIRGLINEVDEEVVIAEVDGEEFVN